MEYNFDSLLIHLKAKERTQNANVKVEDSARTCDICGAEMIRRKSKFNDGFWWGCLQFPRCRNTAKEKKYVI